MHYFYPERMVDAGNAAGAAQVRAHAQAKAQACLSQIDAQLAGHGGPWLLGEALQRRRPVRLHAVPLDAWLRRAARARVPAHRPLPAAHAGPAGGAAAIAAEKLPEPLV